MKEIIYKEKDNRMHVDKNCKDKDRDENSDWENNDKNDAKEKVEDNGSTI